MAARPNKSVVPTELKEQALRCRHKRPTKSSAPATSAIGTGHWAANCSRLMSSRKTGFPLPQQHRGEKQLIAQVLVRQPPAKIPSRSAGRSPPGPGPNTGWVSHGRISSRPSTALSPLHHRAEGASHQLPHHPADPPRSGQALGEAAGWPDRGHRGRRGWCRHRSPAWGRSS